MEVLLINIPAFLFALGVIVFVHELGHHLMAKLFGVRVLTFSLGFGKRLWGFEHRGTDYRVSMIPLGGYVRMSGEMPEERTSDPQDFLNKPRWQRILVYLAGPAMNVVLSVSLIAGVFMVGIPLQALQGIPAVIGSIEQGSAAEKAGWQVGDEILQVDGQEVDQWNDAAFILASSPERELHVELKRGEQTLETTITPVKVPRYEFGETGVFPKMLLRIVEVLPNTPAERARFAAGDEVLRVDGRPIEGAEGFVSWIEAHPGEEISVAVRRQGEVSELVVVPELEEGKGRIGVRLGYYRRLPFGEALVESVRYNIDIVHKTLQILGKLFANEIKPQSALSGPIEIAAWSGRAARQGWVDLIYMMGFLSISIGFMNMLPIPVLDGGHISILLIECLLRRDLSVRLKERVTQLGFMMLMMLMVAVIFFDLAKNLPGLMPGS